MRKFILIVLILGLVILGSQILPNIGAPTIENLQIISPTSDMKILGNSQFIATADTKRPVENLSAVVRINGDEQTLSIQKTDEDSINIGGFWDSGKFQPGSYTLELVILKANSKRELSKTSIPITIIAP